MISENGKTLNGKLDAFVAKVAPKDISLVGELWDDGKFLMVGSEQGEICRTRTELDTKLRAVFANPATLVFDWPMRKITVVGTAAWIFAEGDVVIRASGKGEVRRPYLATCIFENLDGDGAGASSSGPSQRKANPASHRPWPANRGIANEKTHLAARCRGSFVSLGHECAVCMEASNRKQHHIACPA